VQDADGRRARSRRHLGGCHRFDKLGNVGVLYHGWRSSARAILTGLVLAAIGAFIITRSSRTPAAFAAAGAVLTFFGFMHGESIGIASPPRSRSPTPSVAAFLSA